MIRQSCESKFFAYKNRGLGQGNFGYVFEACIGTDCTYAVKVQDITGISDLSKIESTVEISRMVGEAGIGPRIYDALICNDPEVFFREDESNGLSLEIEAAPGYTYYPDILVGTYLFIVMEKLVGSTLDQYLAAGNGLESVFDSIVSTIDSLHALGVIHRDLKADNIFIDLDRRVRLLDFGASQYYPEGAPVPLQEKDKVCTGGKYIWKHDFRQYYV